MRRIARTLIVAVVLLGACLPLAAVTAIALLPAWSWLEATIGIESVGHSGPADWCYGVVYVGWVTLIGGMLLRRRAQRAR
jgi:Ca2+/Na+ antiporter